MIISTPNNINDLTHEQILDLIDDTNTRHVKKKEVRYSIIKLVYNVLGLDLHNEVLLALLDESDRKCIVSPAGGGKTTTVMASIVVEKLCRKIKHDEEFLNAIKKEDRARRLRLNGDRILCLVYTKENVADMVNIHKEMVNSLYSSGIKNLHIDRGLGAKTMHSFCSSWIGQHSFEAGLDGCSLLKDGMEKSYARLSIRRISKRMGIEAREQMSPEEFGNLYNYMYETLTPLPSIGTTDRFKDSKIEEEYFIAVVKDYEDRKRKKHAYDHTDQVVKFREMLINDEEVRTKIQNFYHYITADEFQDFTPIMLDILKLITHKDTPLVCIGDSDQSIYSFRGANPKNILNFTSIFDNSKMYMLKQCRRCPSNVVTMANKIISRNTLRLPVEIESMKGEGTINIEPYMVRKSQYIRIIESLKQMSGDELDDTVICTRDNKSTRILVDMLVKEDIPLTVIKGSEPFSHRLYKLLIELMEMLLSPKDKNLQLNLYKCTEINQKDLYDILKYNADRKVFLDDEKPCFYDVDWGKYATRQSFMYCMNTLKHISLNINKMEMREYVPFLMEFVLRYYWNFMSKDFEGDEKEVDDYFRKSVLDYINVTDTYQEFDDKHSSKKSRYKKYTNSNMGVKVSTHHSLKGLQFDNVIIMDLDDSSFPNFAMIESRDYAPESELELKECETRLMYVAVTRTKKNLTMFYNKNNPSVFLEWIKEPLVCNSILKSAYNKAEVVDTVVDVNTAVVNDETHETDINLSYNNDDNELSDTTVAPTGLISDMLDEDDDLEQIIDNDAPGSVVIKEDTKTVALISDMLDEDDDDFEVVEKSEPSVADMLDEEDEILPDSLIELAKYDKPRGEEVKNDIVVSATDIGTNPNSTIDVNWGTSEVSTVVETEKVTESRFRRNSFTSRVLGRL